MQDGPPCSNDKGRLLNSIAIRTSLSRQQSNGKLAVYRRNLWQNSCHGWCAGQLHRLYPQLTHDLQGTEVLLAQIAADALIAWLLTKPSMCMNESLTNSNERGKPPWSHPKATEKQSASYNRELYKSRDLIENFFCKLKQHRTIATRAMTKQW